MEGCYIPRFDLLVACGHELLISGGGLAKLFYFCTRKEKSKLFVNSLSDVYYIMQPSLAQLCPGLTEVFGFTNTTVLECLPSLIR